jgi:hypothetical protein
MLESYAQAQAQDPHHFCQYIKSLKATKDIAFSVSIHNNNSDVTPLDEVVLTLHVKDNKLTILTNDAHPAAKLFVAVHPLNEVSSNLVHTE